MIDFSKPLEVDTEYSLEEFHGAKILAVYPVNYSNSSFTHAVHYRKENGKEGLEANNVAGVCNSYLAFRNVKPKIAGEFWVNCYADGTTSNPFPGRLFAADEADFAKINRLGLLRTTIYDDGKVEQEYIKL